MSGVTTSSLSLELKPILGSVWKVKTQDPENFDEEVKSLVTLWATIDHFQILKHHKINSHHPRPRRDFQRNQNGNNQEEIFKLQKISSREDVQ